MSTCPTQKQSYTAGHFELQIDGHNTTAYRKSVDGGELRAAVTEGPIGPENARLKQKLWMCSGFRLNIDGVEDIQYTNKIESFTIKQASRSSTRAKIASRRSSRPRSSSRTSPATSRSSSRALCSSGTTSTSSPG